MSGSLRVLNVNENIPIEKHDHVDIVLSNKKLLRYNDPRRFGCILWTNKPYLEHKLLVNLGPEPLENDFNADYLFKKAQKRKAVIKNFIMSGKIVVGVGNIYASEALFLANIHPSSLAGEISLIHYQKLVSAIKQILKSSIKSGGTTLRDFVNSDGKPGYFRQSLQVYGRAGEKCYKCNSIIKQKVIGQRSSYHCPQCQIVISTS
jgi:formamidopyrimidine-DNA glycosylase